MQLSNICIQDTEASIVMDMSMDIHVKSVDMDVSSGALNSTPTNQLWMRNFISTASLLIGVIVKSHRIARCRLLLFRPRQGSAEYCDERVCLSVCLSAYVFVRDRIFGTTRPIFAKFLGRVTNRRGLVLLWRRNATLCPRL